MIKGVRGDPDNMNPYYLKVVMSPDETARTLGPGGQPPGPEDILIEPLVSGWDILMYPTEEKTYVFSMRVITWGNTVIPLGNTTLIYLD